jgi:hypothetical protein
MNENHKGNLGLFSRKTDSRVSLLDSKCQPGGGNEPEKV